MNMTKKSGPKREPCGTQEETPNQDDETPSRTTLLEIRDDLQCFEIMFK